MRKQHNETHELIADELDTVSGGMHWEWVKAYNKVMDVFGLPHYGSEDVIDLRGK